MAERLLSEYYNLVTLGAIKDGQQPATTLKEKNPIVYDAIVIKANEKMGHEGTRVTVLPAGGFRRVGGYKTSQVAQYTPYKEDIAIFDGAAVVPDDVYKIEGAAKVAAVEQQHREGYWQGIANHWINGDSSVTPEKFDGFYVRYNTPDNDGGSNSPENPDTSTAAQVNVYDAGGTGSDTMSILFIRWGIEQVHIITPFNNPQYGLTEIDKGKVEEKQNGVANSWRDVWKKEWEWWHGLCIPNHQCVARIRNIESSLSSIDATLKKLIFRCLNEGMTKGTGTIWMYIPRRMKTHFDVLLEAKQNVIFSRDNPYNVEMPMWGGTIPIQTCDCMGITESAVAAV